MKMNKDLAINYSEMMGSPSSPSAEHYPSTRLEGKEELNLPESGTITFKFNRTREENSTDADGNKRYVCSLDLTKLVSVEGGKSSPTKKHNNAAEALDLLMKAAKTSAADEGEEETY